MAAFQYYFDVKFFPKDFNSYFSKSLFVNPIEVKEVNIDVNSMDVSQKRMTPQKNKYVPQIMEASTVEFKKTKFSNFKKRKNK
jgi:hypothetical protein